MMDCLAKVIEKLAEEVFSIVGRDPLIEVAIALEQAALSDEYLVKRKLYPNVDFYYGLIYRAKGFPTEFFPLLFAIPRMAGYLSHWRESLDDPDTKIMRPAQFKDTTEARPRGSTSSRGGRSGTDRYSGRGGSSQFSSSESGGIHGKSKRENGTSSYTSSYTSSSAPAYGHASINTNRSLPPFSGSTGYENKASTFGAPDVTTPVSQQPSSGYQSAWLGAPGQKSMVDIVKMGRPQPKAFTPPVSSHQQSFEDYAYKAPEVHHEHHVSPDDDWPVIEQPPQVVGVQSFLEPHVEPANADQSNAPYETSHQYLGCQTDEAQAEDENVYEDHTANHVLSRNMQEDTSGSAPLYDNEMYKNRDSFHHEDQAFEHNEGEMGL